MFLIKEKREGNKLTQLQLADKLGITREYLSALENNHKEPSVDLLKRIATILNSSVKDLIQD